MNKEKLAKLSGLAAVVILATGAGCAAEKQEENSAVQPQPQAAVPSIEVDAVNLPADANAVKAPVDANANANYKDGDYAVTTKYMTPGGEHEFNLKLTTKDGIITDATASFVAGHEISNKLGNAFVAAYKPLVVGKPIKGLSLDVVAGASLTTGAFNDALNQIRTKAS